MGAAPPSGGRGVTRREGNCGAAEGNLGGAKRGGGTLTVPGIIWATALDQCAWNAAKTPIKKAIHINPGQKNPGRRLDLDLPNAG